MRQVNLDYQAGTPVLPEVWEAMRPYFTERFGNPSSLHQHGLLARDALAKARTQVAAFLHAELPEEILFTSGGTEAANLAVKGVAYANRRRGNHLVVSALEHPSVLNSVEFLETQGFACTRVPVNAEGWVDPEAVRSAVTDQTILIAVHHVNHDIGTIEPVGEIGRMAQERGIPLFVDAVASGGWLPIEVQDLGASLLSVSPQRFYGPKGVGILYRHRRTRLAGIQHGGLQEGGRRAGTENVPAIVGAGAACEIAARGWPERLEHTARLQQRLWDGLQAQIPYLQLNGPKPGPGRISTNLNVSIEFVEGEGLLLRCDLQGIQVASGTSCLGKSLRIPPVLAAIGLAPALAQGTLILSLGRENTEEEMDYAARVLGEAVRKLRELSPTWDDFQRGLIGSVIQPQGQPVPAGNPGPKPSRGNAD